VESAITVKGQATIPKAVREHLGLRPGDRVKFFVHLDGSVVLLPKLPAAALRGMIRRGMIRRGGRRVTIAAMTRAAAEGTTAELGARRGGADAGKMPAVRNGAKRRAGVGRGSRRG